MNSTRKVLRSSPWAHHVPRTIVLCFQNRWFLLQSAFNDELDEYEKEYSIPCPTPSSGPERVSLEIPRRSETDHAAIRRGDYNFPGNFNSMNLGVLREL